MVLNPKLTFIVKRSTLFLKASINKGLQASPICPLRTQVTCRQIKPIATRLETIVSAIKMIEVIIFAPNPWGKALS